MQRTFNYTGRKRIEQTEALFSFSGPEDLPSFNVEFKINEHDFPLESSLYVEAYYKETRQRYDFGKISKIVPPADRSLTKVDLSGSTLFRVLIVDESESQGLLLASGSSFRADGDSNEEKDRSSILTVVKKPMGQLTWRVDFDTGGPPELCLNTNIPNVIDKMRTDPHFQALVLPAALRQVLMYFLWNEDDLDNEAVGKWMVFAEYFGEEKPESTDPSTLMDWVDNVVSEFSMKFTLCDRLLKAVEEE
ncbi:MAG: hypothetical protein ACI9SP_003271 [Arenicella sp.]